METCVVCNALHRNRLLAEHCIHDDDKLTLVHLPTTDGGRVRQGHLLLFPRRHVECPSDLTSAEAMHMGLWLSKAGRILRVGNEADHVYIHRLGDGWAHLHFHIIPRFGPASEERRFASLPDFPDDRRHPQQDVLKLAARLREFAKSIDVPTTPSDV